MSSSAILKTMAATGAFYALITVGLFVYAIHMAHTHAHDGWNTTALIIPLYGPATAFAATALTTLAAEATARLIRPHRATELLLPHID